MTLLDHTATASEPLDFSVQAATIMLITPSIATAWLTMNRKNREISKTNLAKISRDLNDGHFLFTGESVKISEEGCLLDGQHRLTAIVNTRISAKMVVITGVQEVAQAVMDSGKPRTLPGVLQISGEAQASNLSSVLSGIQTWERGIRLQDNATVATISSSLAFLDANPIVREITRQSATLAPKVPGLTIKQIGQLIWALDHKLDAPADRKDFFAKLVSGAGLPEGDPILALRNFLANDKASYKSVTAYYRMAVTVKAWNAYRQSEQIRSLRFKAGGAKPEAFPEPR